MAFFKSVWAQLEWFGMCDIGFGLTGMACNGEVGFCLDWNGLKWRKSVFG
jgi:hypothetical protein